MPSVDTGEGPGLTQPGPLDALRQRAVHDDRHQRPPASAHVLRLGELAVFAAYAVILVLLGAAQFRTRDA